jgi:hypothetical protein
MAIGLLDFVHCQEFKKSHIQNVPREILHNQELHDLYSSPTPVRVIKSRRMRRAGHVESTVSIIIPCVIICLILSPSCLQPAKTTTNFLRQKKSRCQWYITTNRPIQGRVDLLLNNAIFSPTDTTAILIPATYLVFDKTLFRDRIKFLLESVLVRWLYLFSAISRFLVLTSV